jgi:hypothetical protein
MAFERVLTEYEASIQRPAPIPAYLGAFVEGAFRTTVLTDPSLTYARYLDDTPTVVKHRNRINLDTSDENIPISLYYDEFGNLAILDIDPDQAGSILQADPGQGVPTHNQSATTITSGVLVHERGGLEADVSAFNGLTRIRAGATDAVEGYLETVNVNLTEVGNVGTGEDDLITYTVAANTLSTNLDRLKYRFALTLADNANAKRARVYLDNTALFDSGALPVSAAISVIIEGEIIRESQSVQKTNASMITSSSSLPALANVVGCAEDLATALVLKVTGEATSNDDIVCQSLTVDVIHAP